MFLSKKVIEKEPQINVDKILEHRMDNETLVLKCDSAIIKITAPNRGVIRFRAARRGLFEADHSYAVVDRSGPAPDVETIDNGDEIIFKTHDASLKIFKNPFRMEFLDAKGDVCASQKSGSVGFRGYGPSFSMIAPKDEMYFGLGEKTGGLNKRGRKWSFWNSDIPYSSSTDPLYQSVPALIGLNKQSAYLAFFDNTFKASFDLAAEKTDTWTYEAEDGEINVYFIAGPELPTVVRRYMKLVGGVPMPPRWSLGYHQCRYSYKTDKEVRLIARTLRDLEIPCDVIHLDIHYMRGYRVFTFDPKKFPNPKALSDEMREMGIRLVCIVDPGVKMDPDWNVWRDGAAREVFCKSTRGGSVIKYCWPLCAGWPDFGREDVRQWWGEQHRAYTDAGISGIWNDMNEPSMWNGAFYFADMVVPTSIYKGGDIIHTHAGRESDHRRCRNVYGMLEDRATREGLLRIEPDKRPFVITRSGYAGVGRYAIMWTGDNWSTWAHLRLTIPMLIGLGLTGQPIAGPDTGGFTGNASRELFARWIQLGSLYPFYRGHTMVNSLRHEPWTFGKRVEAIARRFIGFRYRLLPYIYSLVWDAHRDGDPIWRPLCYHFPDDDRAAAIDDQVMVGPFLMAAPVVYKKSRSRSLYLPRGRWLEFFTGEIFEGPGNFEIDAPLESMPLFVREGAIVPMGPLMQHTGEKPLDPLTLVVFPGDGSFKLTEDDGESMGYERGEFAVTPLSVKRTGDSTSIKIGRREGKFNVPERGVVVRVRMDSKPASVSLKGKQLSFGEWEFEDGYVEIKFRNNGEETVIVLR